MDEVGLALVVAPSILTDPARQIFFEACIRGRSSGLGAQTVTKQQAILLPRRPDLADVDVYQPGLTGGRAKETMIRFAGPQYQSQGLKPRTVGRFVGDVGHGDQQVDNRLGDQSRHGCGPNVVDCRLAGLKGVLDCHDPFAGTLFPFRRVRAKPHRLATGAAEPVNVMLRHQPQHDSRLPFAAMTPRSNDPRPPVAVRPEGVRPHLEQAVQDGGGRLVEPADAQMLVWTDPTDAEGLRGLLGTNSGIEVVQLLWAGVEDFAAQGLFNDGRTWACGKGVYADPVAEHALAMMLAGLRGLPGRVGATSWGPQWGHSLFGSRVTILGGGGITESLIRLLQPFDVDLTVVRRNPSDMPGVARVVDADQTSAALSEADVVVLALALTADTRGVIDAGALQTMQSDAWLINVARGEHVVTDDLVAALRDDQIAGAALDVTDPEPLPDGHPLWGLDNVIITPHTANTEEMAVPLIAARVAANVRRLAAGEPLIGLVDPESGY